MAVSLRLLVEAAPLIAALDRFGPLYEAAFARRFAWRLGVEAPPLQQAKALIGAAEMHMRETGLSPDAFFFNYRNGRNAPDDGFGEALAALQPTRAPDDPLWAEAAPPSLVIDEVEAIWSAIDANDDWQVLGDSLLKIRALGRALGPPPAGPFG